MAEKIIIRPTTRQEIHIDTATIAHTDAELERLKESLAGLTNDLDALGLTCDNRYNTLTTNINKKGERVHRLKIGSSGKGSSSKITVSDVVVSPDDGWKIDNAKSNALYIVDITSSTYAPDGTLFGCYIGPAILEVIRIESNSTLTSITQQLYSATRNIQERTLNLQREFDTTNSVWGDWHEERTLNDDTLLRYTGVITVNSSGSDLSNPALWDTSDIDKVYSKQDREYYTLGTSGATATLQLGKTRLCRQTIRFLETNGTVLKDSIGLLLWSNDAQVLVVVFNEINGAGSTPVISNIKFYHRYLLGSLKFTEFQPFSSDSSQSVSIQFATDEDIDNIINSLDR